MCMEDSTQKANIATLARKLKLGIQHDMSSKFICRLHSELLDEYSAVVANGDISQKELETVSSDCDATTKNIVQMYESAMQEFNNYRESKAAREAMIELETLSMLLDAMVSRRSQEEDIGMIEISLEKLHKLATQVNILSQKCNNNHPDWLCVSELGRKFIAKASEVQNDWRQRIEGRINLCSSNASHQSTMINIPQYVITPTHLTVASTCSLPPEDFISSQPKAGVTSLHLNTSSSPTTNASKLGAIPLVVKLFDDGSSVSAEGPVEITPTLGKSKLFRRSVISASTSLKADIEVADEDDGDGFRKVLEDSTQGVTVEESLPPHYTSTQLLEESTQKVNVEESLPPQDTSTHLLEESTQEVNVEESLPPQDTYTHLLEESTQEVNVEESLPPQDTSTHLLEESTQKVNVEESLPPRDTSTHLLEDSTQEVTLEESLRPQDTSTHLPSLCIDVQHSETKIAANGTCVRKGLYISSSLDGDSHAGQICSAGDVHRMSLVAARVPHQSCHTRRKGTLSVQDESQCRSHESLVYSSPYGLSLVLYQNGFSPHMRQDYSPVDFVSYVTLVSVLLSLLT